MSFMPTVDKKALEKMTATNGTAKTTDTALKSRVEKLEAELAETRWCFAEFLWKLKLQAVLAQMDRPEVKEQIAQQMLAKMEGQGA